MNIDSTPIEPKIGDRFRLWGGQVLGAYVDPDGTRWPNHEVGGVYQVVGLSRGEVILQLEGDQYPFVCSIDSLRAILVKPWCDPTFMPDPIGEISHAPSR